MNKTCKKCKYWNTKDTKWSFELSSNFQVCSKITGEHDDGALKDVYTVGHYGHESGLVTRSDFSCKLFEERI